RRCIDRASGDRPRRMGRWRGRLPSGTRRCCARLHRVGNHLRAPGQGRPGQRAQARQGALSSRYRDPRGGPMKAHPDVNDTLRSEGPDAVRARHDRAHRHHKANGPGDAKASETSDVAAFPFILAKDIKIEPKEFLIEGVVGRHETSAWYGPPDVGKSTV